LKIALFDREGVFRRARVVETAYATFFNDSDPLMLQGV